VIARRLFRILTQMVIHLGVQHALGQCLLEFVEQTIGLEQRLGVTPGQ